MTPDVAIASRFASKFPLGAIHLAELRGRLVAPMNTKGELDWKLDLVAVRWGVDEGLLKVLVPFSLTITLAKVGAAPNAVVEIGAIFRLDYVRSTDVQASDEELGHFAGIHGMMHSWPYFRAEVQTLTSKMEVPPLTLPALVSGKIPELASVEQLILPNDADSASHEPPTAKKRSKRSKHLRRRATG